MVPRCLLENNKTTISLKLSDSLLKRSFPVPLEFTSTLCLFNLERWTCLPPSLSVRHLQQSSFFFPSVWPWRQALELMTIYYNGVFGAPFVKCTLNLQWTLCIPFMLCLCILKYYAILPLLFSAIKCVSSPGDHVEDSFQNFVSPVWVIRHFVAVIFRPYISDIQSKTRTKGSPTHFNEGNFPNHTTTFT